MTTSQAVAAIKTCKYIHISIFLSLMTCSGAFLQGFYMLLAGSAWEQHFVRQVIELHDKYMLYVCDCFANSSLFHKALKEAFEFFCNKNVAGSSTAELMANFCDNLLRKVLSNLVNDLDSCTAYKPHTPYVTLLLCAWFLNKCIGPVL